MKKLIEIPELYHPRKAMFIDDDGYLQMIDGRPMSKRAIRRQDLEKAYVYEEEDN